MNLTKKLALFVGCALLAVLPTQASSYTIGDTVDVRETHVSPGQRVTINSSTLGTLTTSAGLTHLVVDGRSVVGFCADPFQASSRNVQPYTVAALSDAPVGDPMGAAAATIIAQLWTMYYSTALWSNDVAAGLQIAIWETIGGSNFTLMQAEDYGAAAMLSAVTGSNIGSADLVALTSRTYQDYVVGVPDGGATVMLLGLGLLGLAAIRKLKIRQS